MHRQWWYCLSVSYTHLDVYKRQTFTNAEGKEHIYSVEPMEVIKKEGNLYTFQVKHSLSNSGSFKVAYRMFPKNVDLPHRQDFCYVRWFN